MSLIGKDWWVWDEDGLYWRAIRSGRTTEPVVVEPDPDDPGQDDPVPDPDGREVLLVTETGTLGAGNQALHDILVADGWTVTVRSLADDENYDGISVLVVSAGNPAQDAGAYRFPQVGVVAVDSWRRLGMGAGLDYASSPLDVTVVDPSSPLAAGQSGTFPAYLAEAWLTWKPESDAALQTVVTRAGQPDQRVVFAYEAGAQMPGRYATTRHVGLGYHQNGFDVGLSSQAQAQFLAAVRWARDTTRAPLPAPAAPTNLSASTSDSQVRLAWSAPEYAETYTVRRHTVTGGPYTVIASQVAATSYTDTSAVNDTEYFYVVAAKNAFGIGPDSAEVSATPTAVSSENLAMLVTSAELAMWQDRAANGPFKVRGDFSPNSPPHWSEMQAMMSLNFSSQRWAGPATLNDGSDPANHPPGAVRKNGPGNSPPSGVRRMAHDMMSAAYAALITGNNAVAQAITNEIEWQLSRPNLQWGNRTLYPYNYHDDIGPFWAYAMWCHTYLMAYDVTKYMGFPSSIVESQFLALADPQEQMVHANLSVPFPNRRSNSYTSRASWVNGDHSMGSHRLANGTIIYFPRILRFYNNRRHHAMGFVGLVGALMNDSYYKEEFKRWMREVVMFGTRLGTYGGHGDYNRGADHFPQLGHAYGVHGFEGSLPAMDALARQGDTDLYDFSTTDGSVNASWGSAGPKTMEGALEGMLKWVAGTWPKQYTATAAPPAASVAGDPFYLVQSRDTGSNLEVVLDGSWLYAANYYNRSDWYDIIMRKGTPSGFTNSPKNAGVITGWKVDYRTRFLRSLEANPYA